MCHTLCMVRKGLYVSYPVYGKKGLICVILCVWYERVYMCHTLCMVRKG